MSATTRFDRFVTAVHRRAVMLRIVESAGIGLLGAAVLTVVIASLTTLSPVHRMRLAAVVAGAAVLGCAVQAFKARPTKLASMIEADRQLKLDDLLSSALTANDDDFGRLVRTMAERTSARLSPSQVVLSRFGVRAWGGIGLAWATVIVLGLLAGNGATSRAREQVPTTEGALASKPGEIGSSSAGHLAAAEKGADDNRGPGAAGVEQPAAGRGDAAGSKTDSASAGGGGGHAETNSGRISPTESHAATAAGTRSPTGQSAGGSGTGEAGIGTGTTGGLSGSGLDRSTAPWQSDHWPADRAAALQSVRDGRVPDAYRDLVRDYFEPNQK
jgi:hypothetical protein